MTPAHPDIRLPLLPNREETLLLRACLYSGESARRAWCEARELWEGRAKQADSDLDNGRRTVKTLWPLLLSALQRNGIIPDRALLALIRTAYLREELRGRIYYRICRHVLTTLAASGIPVIVLNGAALAETAYDDPVLRHCHDIDLLVMETDRARAARVLCSVGFSCTGSGSNDVMLKHPSGLPVELHTSAIIAAYGGIRTVDLWSRSQCQSVSGVSTRVLSPADNLLHTCGYASCYKLREPLRWICDAWFIIQRYPLLDWSLLFGSARDACLHPPLFDALSYLAEDLRAPLPPLGLSYLRAAINRTGRLP